MWKAVGHLQKAIAAGGVDPKLLALVHLRASQINSGRSSMRTGRPMPKSLAGVVLGSPTAATPNPS